MSKIEYKEKVRIEYKDDKIRVKGDSVDAVLNISSDQLSKVYFGGIGTGEIKINMTIPDANTST